MTITLIYYLINPASGKRTGKTFDLLTKAIKYLKHNKQFYIEEEYTNHDSIFFYLSDTNMLMLSKNHPWNNK